jgi:hypothetical protein
MTTFHYCGMLLLASGLAPACRRPAPPGAAFFYMCPNGMPVEFHDTTGVDFRERCRDSAGRPAPPDTAAADTASPPPAPGEALQTTGR